VTPLQRHRARIPDPVFWPVLIGLALSTALAARWLIL
jgi:hypothetical protein